MAYLLIAALLSGFGAGFIIERQITKAVIQAMENDIAASNAKAQAILNLKTLELSVAKNQAILSNLNLDKSHAATIDALNAQSDTNLANFSLYTKSRDRCPNTVPGSNIAGISENATREAELDAETNRVIKEAGIIADIAADYAENAYQFAAINNCGIKSVQTENPAK